MLVALKDVIEEIQSCKSNASLHYNKVTAPIAL